MRELAAGAGNLHANGVQQVARVGEDDLAGKQRLTITDVLAGALFRRSETIREVERFGDRRAVTGGAWLGRAVGSDGEPLASLDVTMSAAVVVASAFALVSDPRQALGVLAGAFMAHALVDVAHRPGWLSPAIAPRWFTVGCAAYDVYLAALCYWARRR